MGAKTVLWCREKVPFMALWLVFLTIPLAISLTKYAAIIFLITFLWSGYWRQLRPNIFVLTIAIIFIINIYDLFRYHLAANDYEPVRHIWYLWFLPLVAVMPWQKKDYVYLLRSFIVALTTNGLIGILQVLGWHFRDLLGQGPIGLAQTHITFSMMLASGLLLLMFAITEKTLFWSPRIALGIFILLLWQLMFTIGRTGQAVYFILALLVLLWMFPRYRVAGTVAGFVLAGIALLSPVLRSRWIQAVYDVYLFFNGWVITSVGLRLVYAHSAIQMFAEHPFFGVGAGQFRTSYYDLARRGLEPKLPPVVDSMIGPNNSFLAYLSELGLFGFIPLVILIGYLGIRAWRHSDPLLRYVQVVTWLWFVLGSFADTFIWLEGQAIPFAILMAVQYGQEKRSAPENAF
ncbi:hypothetical protein DLNHIDIE_01029 [Acidithiobacillus thiooxidans ATCC 19377]|uniref:O-antigen ligase-related domain-containing protein n=3 Tax=Acidithiobacillaceae TaxID=225058 RepID=A0A543Q4A0_ACITH|nr:hypothetical protein DLNHIDIE_01029 [Acidithiobacillus thiooxidans ATCC 19377]